MLHFFSIVPLIPRKSNRGGLSLTSGWSFFLTNGGQAADARVVEIGSWSLFQLREYFASYPVGERNASK